MNVGINEFLKQAKGVIHVGASYGQERDVYADLGLPVVWIEAHPDVYAGLKSNLVGRYAEQRALNYLVTDKDDEEYNFGVSNNSGFSSSIFPLKEHKEVWPDIEYADYRSLKSKTLKSIVEIEGIDLSQFDALILDTQGAELKVLEGAEDILKHFRFIRSEASDVELYEGGCLDHQLDSFLKVHGFQRAMTWEVRESTIKRGIFEILYETVATRKNVQILDPETEKETWAKVGVLTSVPRLGFQVHDTIMHNSFGGKGWPIIKVGGAFWEQAMQNGLNKLIALGCDYVITVDYDSIFHPDDVNELLLMAARYPEADAVAAWQVKRQGNGEALMGFRGENGHLLKYAPKEWFDKEVTEADHAVFGLTLIKTASLQKMPKPWFKSEPNADGEWGHGKCDADGYFWRKWRQTGLTIYAANNVKIGHLEEFILWIDNDFNVIRQRLQDFYNLGRPF